MENLNKENFWNKAYKEYPEATQTFCDWIDEYKKQNNWNQLFHKGYRFHDIPLEMQLGILQAFAFDFPADLKDAPTLFRLASTFGSQIAWAGMYFEQLQETLTAA